MLDLYKALEDAQKLRALDHAEFKRERDQWKTERAQYEAEIARLTAIAAAAGRVDLTVIGPEHVLELRCRISRDALELSRTAEEVFHASILAAMSEFRTYLHERRLKRDSTYRGAEAFADARKGTTPHPPEAER